MAITIFPIMRNQLLLSVLIALVLTMAIIPQGFAAKPANPGNDNGNQGDNPHDNETPNGNPDNGNQGNDGDQGNSGDNGNPHDDENPNGNPDNGNNGNDGEQGNSGDNNGNDDNNGNNDGDHNDDGHGDNGNGNDCNGQSCEDHGNDDEGDDEDDGGNNVTVCHNGSNLEINENAAQAHLDHGDTLGECITEPPVECTPPQIPQGDECVDPPIICEPPLILDGDECVSPPVVCEEPLVLVDDVCVLPDDDSGNAEPLPGGCGVGDCTPPTIGLLHSHRQYVKDGFGINNEFYNVAEYSQFINRPNFTNSNIIFLKIYENSGVQNLAHIALGLNLETNQFIGQNAENITIDIAYDGTITLNSSGFDSVGSYVFSDGVFTYVVILFDPTDEIGGDKLGVLTWDRQHNAGNNYFYFN